MAGRAHGAERVARVARDHRIDRGDDRARRAQRRLARARRDDGVGVDRGMSARGDRRQQFRDEVRCMGPLDIDALGQRRLAAHEGGEGGTGQPREHRAQAVGRFRMMAAGIVGQARRVGEQECGHLCSRRQFRTEPACPAIADAGLADAGTGQYRLALSRHDLWANCNGGRSGVILTRAWAMSCCLALLLVGFPAAAKDRTASIVIRAGKTDSPSHALARQFAEAVAVAVNGACTLDVQESQGSVQNVIDAAKAPRNFVFTAGPDDIAAAQRGRKPFAPDPRYREIRALFPMPAQTRALGGAPDSGITSARRPRRPQLHLRRQGQRERAPDHGGAAGAGHRAPGADHGHRRGGGAGGAQGQPGQRLRARRGLSGAGASRPRAARCRSGFSGIAQPQLGQDRRRRRQHRPPRSCRRGPIPAWTRR